MKKFSSILVANRGEIAVRVMRTAKSLGYRTIAVYSAADADAPYTKLADEAVAIGAGPANESYLRIDTIIEAARLTGAGAIHPGYGFLSENAEFARSCEAAGIIFIGPGAAAIELMGNKAAAKRQMQGASVRCVPGFEGDNADDEALIAAAAHIGFPIMVKAAAGGGGRGMSLVDSADKLPAALVSARSVAQNSFGSSELILERALLRPRHVEVQIFADQHGNIIHLGERDCSVQRRHQKVVEEAPCPVMTKELRSAMCRAAVEAARAIDYCGAGTVEFLLDNAGEFYFLEMNTRLQVEHAVTEMVTGLDLVAMQLSVAQGEVLGISQQDVYLNGHAIEVRLYAEDPGKGFLPRTGEIELWKTPDNVRVDSGIEAGQLITPFYDSMLAKIIVWGESRTIACQRLIEALKSTLLFGAITNRDFLIRILQHEAFQNGDVTTGFIEETFSKQDLKSTPPSFVVSAMAAAIFYQLDTKAAFAISANVSSALLRWSSSGDLCTRYRLNGGDYLVMPAGNNSLAVSSVDRGRTLSIEIERAEDNVFIFTCDRQRQKVYYFVNKAGELKLSIEGVYYTIVNDIAITGMHEDNEGAGSVLAPMHGIVQEILVRSGDRISKGQRLLVVEAMKMQHDVLAGTDGFLKTMAAVDGQQVEAGQLLAVIE